MKHAFSRMDSGTFDPVTKRYMWPPGVNATGRRMLFTGPDGIRNQNVSVEEDNQYVGIGTMSPEGSSELAYLYRPDWKNAPSLLPKHRRVGEIGWGIPMYSDPSVLQTGKQITRGEFRQSAEDRHTHLYQNPWTPPIQPISRPRTAPVRSSLRHDDYLLETDHYRSQMKAVESSSSDVSSQGSLHSRTHY